MCWQAGSNRQPLDQKADALSILFLFLLEVEVINFTNHKDPDSPS